MGNFGSIQVALVASTRFQGVSEIFRRRVVEDFEGISENFRVTQGDSLRVSGELKSGSEEF